MYDASSISGDQLGASATWLHTVGSASNRVLTIALSYFTNPSNMASVVTFDGTPATKHDTAFQVGNFRLEWWTLNSPTVGSHPISVTLPGAANWNGSAVSLNGINLAVPPNATGGAQLNSGGDFDAVGGTYSFGYPTDTVTAISTDDVDAEVVPGETLRQLMQGTNGYAGIGTWIGTPIATNFQPGWTHIADGRHWAIGSLAFQLSDDAPPPTADGGLVFGRIQHVPAVLAKVSMP